MAVNGIPISQLRDVTCHMGSHSVTCHPTLVNAPRLNPSQLADTRFTYPGRMEGWVDLDYLAMHRLGVEPAIFRSLVRRPNHYTAEPCVTIISETTNRGTRGVHYWEPIKKWPRRIEWWRHWWRHATRWRHINDLNVWCSARTRPRVESCM